MNIGKRWTVIDDSEVVRLKADDKSIYYISQYLNRSYESIQCKLADEAVRLLHNGKSMNEVVNFTSLPKAYIDRRLALSKNKGLFNIGGVS